MGGLFPSDNFVTPIGSKGLFSFAPIIIAPPPPAQMMRIGGPNSTGPWLPDGQGLGGFQSGATNGFFGMGALIPFPYFFNGQRVEVIAFTDRILGQPTDSAGFTVGLAGALLQTFFTKIVLGPPLSLTFLTALATGYDNGYVAPNSQTYTQWGWASAFDITPFLGDTITVAIS